MLAGELLTPRRLPGLSRLTRWSANLGLMLINTIVLRILLPAAAVGIAYSTGELGWGLFNRVDQPQTGHDEMTIGIPGFREASQVDRLPGMLMLPFIDKP